MNERDIMLAAELAPAAPPEAGPFQQGEMSVDQLQEKIEGLVGGASQGREETVEEEAEQDEKKKAMRAW